MRDPVVLVHDCEAIVKNTVVHHNLPVARRHALSCEARDGQKDLLAERLDTPRKSELHVEGRDSRLKHSFMLPVPVKRAFCPVVVTIEHIWHAVVVCAVDPFANHMINLVYTDVLHHQHRYWIVHSPDKISQHYT